MVDGTVKDAAKNTDDASAQNGQTIVLDFGSKSRRKIKRLRKGQGSLMDRVNDTVAEFKRNQTIAANAAVVVVVVKQRNRSKGIFG